MNRHQNNQQQSTHSCYTKYWITFGEDFVKFLYDVTFFYSTTKTVTLWKKCLNITVLFDTTLTKFRLCSDRVFVSLTDMIQNNKCLKQLTTKNVIGFSNRDGKRDFCFVEPSASVFRTKSWVHKTVQSPNQTFDGKSSHSNSFFLSFLPGLTFLFFFSDLLVENQLCLTATEYFFLLYEKSPF